MSKKRLFITLTRSTCNSKSMSSFDLTVFFQCSFAEMNRKPLLLSRTKSSCLNVILTIF